jgi:hypothetical protein
VKNLGLPLLCTIKNAAADGIFFDVLNRVHQGACTTRYHCSKFQQYTGGMLNNCHTLLYTTAIAKGDALLMRQTKTRKNIQAGMLQTASR